MYGSPQIVRGYLIVRSDGTHRTVTRVSNLRLDEVAFPLTITIPKTWGRIQEERIEIAMPNPPAALVKAAKAQTAKVK